MKEVKTLRVVGKRWFNAGPGNTYHSADIYVNGEQVHRIDYAYGYGDQYLDNAAEWLEQNGYIDRKKNGNGPGESLWRYAERVGVEFTYNVTDVKRKKEL